MFITASQVSHWATWHRLNQSCEGCKFPIPMHRCDAKATMEVVLVYLLECFEYLQHSLVRKVVYCREANLATHNVKKKGILLTKKMSTVKKTSLCSFNNSTGTFAKSFATGLGLLCMVIPFYAAIFFPKS
jgi:hypothetical protein